MGQGTGTSQHSGTITRCFSECPAAGAIGSRYALASEAQFERPLWIVTAIAGLLLLIACSNIANLFMARAAARERELALRVSIGAGRARLMQQVLIESGLLVCAACALGLAFAVVTAPAIVASLAPSDFPAYLDLRIDGRVPSFLALVGGLTTVLFGMVPAVRAQLLPRAS